MKKDRNSQELTIEVTMQVEDTLPKLLLHTSIIVNQYATIKCLEESVGSNEALMHMKARNK